MSKPTFNITGTIGYWGASYNYVKDCLKGYENKPVTVRLSSLGGDVNEALKIAAEFETHGNVTIEMVGMNASASTLLALGAKKVKLHENSLFLIHKCMLWIDEWGSKNADEINATIDNLQLQKENAEKVDSVIVKMYTNKCKSKKTAAEITAQMKKGNWLTADEAVEFGLVDEIFKGEDTIVNDASNGFFNAVGLPEPPKKKEGTILSKIKNIINKKEMGEIKSFKAISKLLNKEEEVKDEPKKVEIEEKDLDLINEALEEREKDAEKIKNLEEELAKYKGKPAEKTTNVVTGERQTEDAEDIKIPNYKNAKELFKRV